MFQGQTVILWAEPRESTESLSNFQEKNCGKTEISQHQVPPTIIFIGVGKGVAVH